MSALGNLFSDIAGAIREKTGETGTMKPAQFPEKILGIETGGGGSGGGGKMFRKFLGSTVKAVIGQRIDVDIGFQPDAILLFPQVSNDASNSIIMYFGLSRKAAEAYGITSTMASLSQSGGRSFYNAYSGVYIEDAQDINQLISNASETGFYLAKSTPANVGWILIAFGGLA